MRVSSVLTAVILAVVVVSAAGCGKKDPVAVRFERASQLLGQKKFMAARSEIDSAIAADPQKRSSYLKAMAVYDVYNRHGDKAEIGELMAERSRMSKLDRALTQEEIAALYSIIGRAYWQARALDAAERAYLHAMRLAPENSVILNDLGYLYADENIKLPEALRLTQMAVDLDPDNGIVLDSLGWAQYRSGDYAKAAETLKRAVRLHPDEAEIRYHLGAVFARQGLITEARIELSKSLILDKSLPDAREVLRKLQR